MVEHYNGNSTINNIKENSFVIFQPENFNNNNNCVTNNNNNNNGSDEIQKNNDYYSQLNKKYQPNSNENNCENVDLINNNNNNQQQQHQILNLNNRNITVAKRRWKILAKALCINNKIKSAPTTDFETTSKRSMSTAFPLQKQCFTKSTNLLNKLMNKTLNDDIFTSVRRFTSFGLIKKQPITCNESEQNENNWFVYKIETGANEYKLNINHINRPVTPDDLMGFNNTGNICVWPSEEALAYLILNELPQFNDRNILELGGGMTSLAGLLIAKYCTASYVHLTDGNDLSVDNVGKILANNQAFQASRIHYSVLKWECIKENPVSTLEKEFHDFILCADCLFFDEARAALIDAIWYFLKSDGCAWVMAPHRGKTLNLFIQQAETKGFQCEIINCYNQVVWEKHLEFKQNPLYDENIHYPILIKLRKK